MRKRMLSDILHDLSNLKLVLSTELQEKPWKNIVTSVMLGSRLIWKTLDKPWEGERKRERERIQKPHSQHWTFLLAKNERDFAQACSTAAKVQLTEFLTWLGCYVKPIVVASVSASASYRVFSAFLSLFLSPLHYLCYSQVRNSILKL